MAIERTYVDDKTVLTPKVMTEELKIGDTVVNKVIQTVIDDPAGIVVGSAINPWATNLQQQITDALNSFQSQINTNIYEHPDTHPADMITETVDRIWYTPAERTKLAGIAVGANNYTHPASHSADMITETATEIWMTPAERTKLSGIAVNANNYTHPASHSADMITTTATEVWMTPAERTKLTGVADNANNYTHPASHSADMITTTATRVWMTPAERTKLNGIATSANNYTHPVTHPISIIPDLFDGAYIKSELIRALDIQRINTRQSVLTEWNYATLGYVNASGPGVVFIGSGVFTISATVANPFIATIANGYNSEYGNVDSIVVLTSSVSTPNLSTYGFTNGTCVYIMLRENGTLYVTSTQPIFDYKTMKGTPASELCIGVGYVVDNLFATLPDPYKSGLISPNKCMSYITGYYTPGSAQIITLFNRLLTINSIVQIFFQKQGEDNWTLCDCRLVSTDQTTADYNYGFGFDDLGNSFVVYLFSTTATLTPIRFKINTLRMY